MACITAISYVLRSAPLEVSVLLPVTTPIQSPENRQLYESYYSRLVGAICETVAPRRSDIKIKLDRLICKITSDTVGILVGQGLMTHADVKAMDGRISCSIAAMNNPYTLSHEPWISIFTDQQRIALEWSIIVKTIIGLVSNGEGTMSETKTEPQRDSIDSNIPIIEETEDMLLGMMKIETETILTTKDIAREVFASFGEEWHSDA